MQKQSFLAAFVANLLRPFVRRAQYSAQAKVRAATAPVANVTSAARSAAATTRVR